MAKTISSRSAQSKKASAAKSAAGRAAANKLVTVDRRERSEKVEKSGDRRKASRRSREEPVAVESRLLERREKVNRRRQIDPTTCEREYTEAEVEFMNALELYKRKNGRMFPTCSEILEVIVGLGYRKMSEVEAVAVGEITEPAMAQTTTEQPAAETITTL